MADVQWTTAQLNAIQDEGGTLLVSAAAGSGKTAVLVERAFRMITRQERPVSADSLLIVTFTNAAAEELRSRIGARLEAELSLRPDDFGLRKQRLLLRRAFIGTMDAFCQQLVRENFAALGIPPDIAVADASLLEQLSANCLAQTMEEMYADPDFTDFVALYGRSRSDKDAEKAILALYDFTRTLPYPDKQLERFAAMYDENQSAGDSPWGRELLAFAGQGAEAALGVCRQAMEIARQEPELAAYLAVLALDEEAWERLLLAVRHESWDAALSQAESMNFAALRGGPRGYESAAKEQVKTLREMGKDIHKELMKYCFVCSEEDFQQDRKAAGPMVKALCRAAALYSEKFTAAKMEERALDFADFEHLALQLLVTPSGERTGFADQISRRYSTVMVDEYQDTNELQDALYTCLGNPEGSNLFYVGDVKQSIYRFRKANPGIFMEKKDSFAPFESGNHPAVLTLGHNFRSGEGVVQGVNYVFEALMSRQLGEVEYNEQEKLIRGAEEGIEDGFELQIIGGENKQAEPGYVAGRIRQMVQQGVPVRDKTGLRPCTYGDFCILLRARSKMVDFVAALEAAGIPVVADNSEQLLETPEVLPLTAALCAIDNPGDDVSLGCAMLGPLFRFTPEELAAMRAERRRESLWRLLLESDQPRVREFLQEFEYYRALAGQVPAGRLCEEIMERTGYLSAVAAMEGGSARQENLYRFIGWANGVSETGRGGLAGFVRLLQSGKDPEAAAVKSLPGHVTLLTIHKSKGLEFPVCILADVARGFNTRDLVARVQMHAELGVGIWLREGDVLFPTLQAMAIRRRIEKETLSEEMRILYVALTRAKDRMLVTMSCKDPQKYLSGKATAVAAGMPGSYILGDASCMGDWITMAALCHPMAGPLLEYSAGVIPAVRQTQGKFATGVLPPSDQPPAPEQQEAFRLTAEPDPETVRRLQEQFARRLPRESLAGVPVKLSVSAIVKPEDGSILKRPSFMYKSGLTAAEKGTAQHAFMQFADFRQAEQNLPAEIQRLEAEGFITPEMGKALDRQGIERFLASSLAGRMSQAGKLWREYDFITALPAASLQPGLALELAQEPVMVQGIVDLVLEEEGSIEIADYKTDRGKTAAEMAELYRGQLQLYRQAVEKRFRKPVKKLTIWSFYLGEEIDVPLDEQE